MCFQHFNFVDSGELFTWGSNNFGQLGHGDKVDRFSPEKVMAFKARHVFSVKCGGYHMGALLGL